MNNRLAAMRHNVYMLTVISAIACSVATGQQTFNKLFGGPGEDLPWALRARTDTTYVLVGETNSNLSSNDILAINFDNRGDIIWARRFGGDANEYVRNACVTPTNHLILAGWTTTVEAQGDVYLAELDTDGHLVWSTTAGLQASEWAQSVLLTSDDSLVVIGQATRPGFPSNQYPFILKADRYGRVKWMRTYYTGMRGTARSIIETPDGGYLVSGWVYPSSNSDILLMKFDRHGTLLWCKAAGGASDEDAIGMIKTSQGSVFVVGGTRSYGAGGGDVFIMKMTTAGQVEWTKTVGGAGYERGHTIEELPNGQLLLSGETHSFNATMKQSFLARLDTSGSLHSFNLISATTPSNRPLGIGLASAVASPDRSGYVIIAWEDREGAGGLDIAAAKTDSSGRLASGDTLVSPQVSPCTLAFTDCPYSIGSAFTLSSLLNEYDASISVITRTIPITTSVNDLTSPTVIPGSFSVRQNFPNPFNPSTTMEFDIPERSISSIQIFSTDGRLVETLGLGELPPGTHRVEWKPQGLPSGAYFFRVQAGKFSGINKMVLIK